MKPAKTKAAAARAHAGSRGRDEVENNETQLSEMRGERGSLTSSKTSKWQASGTRRSHHIMQQR